MHVDLSWRGRNLAIDPGTFSYNAPEPWGNRLAGTGYHNTVTVDDMDQMDRVGRFLWCPWPHAAAQGVSRNDSDNIRVWQGYHDGFARRRGLGRHRRAIVGFGRGRWLVLDHLGASDVHRFRLHWLLADVRHVWDAPDRMLRLDLPEGRFFVGSCSAPDIGRSSLVRADPGTPRGWMAPTYGEREPALSFALEVEADNALFATWFGPEPARIQFARNSCDVRVDGWTARVEFSEHVNSLVERVEVVNSANTRQVWG
jgi:asparagine synthase (glutamine-hydrolysing)